MSLSSLSSLSPSSDCICNSDDLLANIVGYAAGILIAISFICQIIWMLKNHSFKDVTHIFLLIQLVVAILYLVYGIIKNLPPIYVMEIIINYLDEEEFEIVKLNTYSFIFENMNDYKKKGNYA